MGEAGAGQRQPRRQGRRGVGVGDSDPVPVQPARGLHLPVGLVRGAVFAVHRDMDPVRDRVSPGLGRGQRQRGLGAGFIGSAVLGQQGGGRRVHRGHHGDVLPAVLHPGQQARGYARCDCEELPVRLVPRRFLRGDTLRLDRLRG